jgi:tetratricopeptide (TPR) repeat protein
MKQLNIKINIKPYIKPIAIGLLCLFLLFNIIASQTISPLYFNLVNDGKKSTINFLQKIRNQEFFTKIYQMNKNIYGENIENEVFGNEKNRQLLITNYQQALEKNPESRDALYNLYILYKKEGNLTKAKEFLYKARLIDPNL